MTPVDTLPESTSVGRVALRVGDLDRLTEFYRDVVGLSVRERCDEHATLGADDRALLELFAAPDRSEREPSETGLFHTAFLLPSRADLGDALSRIRERWHLDGASDHLVSEALYLDDPEGNGIEIYRDRPHEEWPIEGDRVEMDTLPLDLDALEDRRRGGAGVPTNTTVGHVHLEISSLARAREFYVDGLGLGVRQEWSDAALFVAAGDYHHHLGLNTWNGRTVPPRGRGLAWFELVVPDRAALSALRDRLEGRGIETRDHENGIVLTDPDGIELRVRPDPIAE
ncbi:MAG: VOC family protein [Halalkalicoccus sp.]